MIVSLCLRQSRDGSSAYDDIDLDRLSPRARALAEAIGQRPEQRRGAIRALTDQDDAVQWSNWSYYPVDSAMDPHDYLEQQAGRFPNGWTIAGSRAEPVPSLAGQGEEWIVAQCAQAWGVKPATWRSYVNRGQAPQPKRRIGSTPVWDPAEVVAWERPGPGARRDWPTEGLSDVAKQVVGVAVELSLKPREAFDYGIATGSDRCLHWLDEAIIDAACETLPPLTTGINGTTREQAEARGDERRAAARSLREQIGDDLAKYRDRCGRSRYTGWSKESRQPIQREDPPQQRD